MSRGFSGEFIRVLRLNAYLPVSAEFDIWSMTANETGPF